MLLQVILDNNLQNTTLVGHSLAGVWMQLLLQQIPERIGMLIFIDAVALETGESFFSNAIAGVVPTYPAYPSQACSSTNPVSHCVTYQHVQICDPRSMAFCTGNRRPLTTSCLTLCVESLTICTQMSLALCRTDVVFKF